MKSTKPEKKLSFDEFKKLPPKDRTYQLRGTAMPLVFVLGSKHSKSNELLYFDPITQTNREMRYCKNQKSVFVDEQDKNFIMEYVEFFNGDLEVKKENLVLQYFLYIHPDRNIKYYEIDLEKIAKEQIDSMDLEDAARDAARALSTESAEAILRVHTTAKVEDMSTEEIKRDIRLFARQYPQTFMDAIEDPELKHRNSIGKMLKQGLITVRNDKDVHFNLEGNQKKMFTIPLGQAREDAILAYFMTDNGVEAYKTLSTKLD